MRPQVRRLLDCSHARFYSVADGHPHAVSVSSSGPKIAEYPELRTCIFGFHRRRSPSPTNEDPPAPDNPVAPAERPARAQAKASGQHDAAGRPYRSFRGLLDHLATLTRNQVRFAGTPATIPMLTEPTSTQREAFDLIGAPIPLTLK